MDSLRHHFVLALEGFRKRQFWGFQSLVGLGKDVSFLIIEAVADRRLVLAGFSLLFLAIFDDLLQERLLVILRLLKLIGGIGRVVG